MAKNEQHCIARAIKSALPYVDSVFLADTGSTDETISVARYTSEGKLFQVVRQQWVDFGSNRTRALHAAQEWLDNVWHPAHTYFLLLDADDEIVSFPDRATIADGPDCFTAIKHSGPLKYPQIQLLRGCTDFLWQGTTHEELKCVGKDAVIAALPGFEYRIGYDGARRLSGKKTPEDIELLQKTLEKDPKDPRALFYLGNSLMVMDRFEEAALVFSSRVGAGGFDEEVYLSWVRMGESNAYLGRTDDAVLCYLEAINIRYFRAEAYTLLAELFLKSGRLRLAEQTATNGLEYHNDRQDRLFVDSTCKQRMTAVIQECVKRSASVTNERMAKMLEGM